MLYKEIPLLLEGSLPGAKLVLYIQEYSKDLYVQERPMMVICPGGGYNHTSDREAEPEALQFLAMGCHVAVLRYSVPEVRYPVQLTELAFAVKYIREHAAEWHVAADKIIVQGSSAGGHLAASLGMFWTEKWLCDKVGAASADEIQPNGMLLCYPVITSGEFAHRGSFDILTGNDEELLAKLSLENQVNAHTPRAFIWHTFEDATVPVENSLMLVGALRKFGIPTEFHMYPNGQHGLALASVQTANIEGKYLQKECESWIGLAKTWIENL